MAGFRREPQEPMYRPIVEKVDSFATAVHAARADDMRCAPGCSACCHVELTVCGVEAAEVARAVAALDDASRGRLAERAGAEPEAGGACVMLEDDRCVVYEARPLVCRTQGLALAYPPGFVPADAVRAKDARGHDVTWCPLNFEASPPQPAEVLDAGRVDAMLALAERLSGGGAEPRARTPLRALARAAAARR